MSLLSKGPIKDFALGIFDGPHATPKESQEGPIFLGIKNVNPDGTLDLFSIRHIAEEDYLKWIRRVEHQPDDIVFSYEATLHRYAIIPEGFKGCLGRRMALIRPDLNTVNPRYLHYYLMSSKWKAIIESNIISGVTVDRISIKKFPEFELELPPLDIQNEIASILYSYDNLIENNKRRIQLLEESASLLYKEWFINLRFPGHEHVNIEDGVPEGWEKKPLGETTNVKKGKNITRSTVKEGSIPVVAGGLTPAYYHDTPNISGPVVTISASGANAGYTNLYYTDIWASDCSYINVKATKSVYYTYLLLQSRQKDLFGMQKGAAQPHVYPKDIQRLEVLTPPSRFIEMFHNEIEGIFDMIAILRKQSGALKKARDLLLPRLMNGEIKV